MVIPFWISNKQNCSLTDNILNNFKGSILIRNSFKEPSNLYCNQIRITMEYNQNSSQLPFFQIKILAKRFNQDFIQNNNFDIIQYSLYYKFLIIYLTQKSMDQNQTNGVQKQQQIMGINNVKMNRSSEQVIEGLVGCEVVELQQKLLQCNISKVDEWMSKLDRGQQLVDFQLQEMGEQQLNQYLDRIIYQNEQDIKECDKLDNLLTSIQISFKNKINQ